MGALILYEDERYRDFLPLTYWRPTCRLRCGRRPLMDRTVDLLRASDVHLWVRPELEQVTRDRHGLQVNQPAQAGDLLVNGRWAVQGTPFNEPAPCVGWIEDEVAFICCDARLAASLTPAVLLSHDHRNAALAGVRRVSAMGRLFGYPWDLVQANGDMLCFDWQPHDAVVSGSVHPSAHLLKSEHVHVGGRCVVGPGAVLDATNGPVYIDDDVTIGAHAVVEGPSFIGARSVINPGAWIRGSVSIGPVCKVGGEVGVSILHALCNKQHHGFVGHSYLAEWVNFGAGTTTSNLKNTYGTVTVPLCGVAINSGQGFCGSIVGDFARTGINQSLTTGTVLGTGSSVAMGRIAPQFVPSFRFLTETRDEPYDPARGLDVAVKVMGRRERKMAPSERTWFERLPEYARRHEMV